MVKGNRTRAFGTLVLILGVVQAYARETIPVEYQGWALTGIGIAIIILREFTNTPAGRNAPVAAESPDDIDYNGAQ